MDDDKLYERVERALAAARFEGDNETLAVIAVIRPVVIDECARVAEAQREDDLDYAARYPDEARKMEDRAHRAGTIAAAIRALKEMKP